MTEPDVTPDRPEPSKLLVAVLSVLFLVACGATGVGRTISPYGQMHYNTNAILSPPEPGMQVVLGPISIRSDHMELLFHPSHPRPQDFPDQFAFVWKLLERGTTREAAVGLIGFDGARYRQNPDDPQIAMVPLGPVRGTFDLVVAPQGYGDFPDVEVYLMHTSATREVAFIVAGCFGAMFLALLAVGVRRHRLALAAWRA